MFARGGNVIGHGVARDEPIISREKFHGEVHAFQFTAGNRQIARGFGPAREHDRIELAEHVSDFQIHAHVYAGLKGHAFDAHLFHAPVDMPFFHFEIRNAVP